jgi:hypothetical protein
MHLISTLSLQAGHTLSKTMEKYFPNIPQVNVLSQQTCILNKMLPAYTIKASLQPAGQAKNMGDATTISRNAAIKIRRCTREINKVRKLAEPSPEGKIRTYPYLISSNA